MFLLQKKVTFLWLLITAFIGLLLRLNFLVPLPFNYTFVLHGHSHLALLAWVYNALFVLLTESFVADAGKYKKYSRLFWVTQIADVGMLFSFPVLGYAFFSIFFSTLHILLSWVFSSWLWNDLKANVNVPREVRQFILAALFFLTLSSAGPFALPLITKFFGKTDPLYFNAVYFYLHFQYNGWISFALFGLVFNKINREAISQHKSIFRQFFYYMFFACIGGVSLSFLWARPDLFVYVPAFISAFIQVIAMMIFSGKILSQLKAWWIDLPRAFRALLWIALSAFVFKVILQFVSAFPFFANMACSSRNLIIAYLHLFLLGFVSTLLFVLLLPGLVNRSIFMTVGTIIFLTGLISSEIMLFLKGIICQLSFSVQEFYLLLFISSLLILTGIVIFVVKVIITR